MKNVVMRIVIEIRERKKRPKLSDFIAVYREKRNECKGDKAEQEAKQYEIKKEFQSKFKMLYGGDATEVK